MSIAVPVLIVVAWGALAFGAVYGWAYGPMMAVAVLIGIWGLVKRVPRVRSRVNRPLLVGLVLVMAAIGVQLIPLHRSTLVDLSPATDQFLREYDLAYATAMVVGTRAGALADNPAQATPAPLKHALSLNPGRTWIGLGLVAGFGVFLLGLARALGGRHLRVFAPGLAGIGLLMAVVAIVQAALWNGKVYGFWQPVNSNAVPFGSFINRNHYAGWMLLALPVVLGYFAAQVTKGMASVSPGWRSRVMWFSTREALRAVLVGVSAITMALALSLTFSRSGTACFLIAMLLAAIGVLRRRHATWIQRTLMIGFLLVCVAAAFWKGVDVTAERMTALGPGLGNRVGLWEDTWRIHRMFPVFGTGFNTFGTSTLLLQRFQADTLHYIEAHNDYLQLLAEGGYLVAVPAALLLALFAWQVRARFKEDRDDATGYWLRLGAVTGIVAILLQDLVEFSLQMPGNFALFTVLCAIAVRKATPKGRR